MLRCVFFKYTWYRLTNIACERSRASGTTRPTPHSSTCTTLRSTARRPAPSDRTSLPRPPHTSALGVPGDTTADESQLRERGHGKPLPGTVRALPRKVENRKKV